MPWVEPGQIDAHAVAGVSGRLNVPARVFILGEDPKKSDAGGGSPVGRAHPTWPGSIAL